MILTRINAIYPIRYTTWHAAGAYAVLGTLSLPSALGLQASVALAWALVALGFYDTRQQRHAILRNYPIIGHLRFMLEFIRPEMRQYFIESDTEAEPFSRAQRTVVYARAKGESDARPFGTQRDTRAVGYEWLHHAMAPTHIDSHDFRVHVGGPGCTQPYAMSRLNISAMSFGALSANAIMALNRGARLGGFAHDTGEGSISRYHQREGGDLVWQIASGYFGCRNAQGGFDPDKFQANAQLPQVKMIEIKLSQGAKPGHGGVLPAAKVSPEIAEARGIPVGVTCVSPASHSAFSTPLELMHFIQRLRELSGGKPVGIKFCVGHPWEWFALVKAMLATDITPDFIVVDGGEGGTGAAPLEFSDHVGMPLWEGLRLVHNTLVGTDLRSRIRLGASGKIITAFDMARVITLGADWCNSARGFMFALGCVQAQHCASGFCPTGITTQDPVRQQALVVDDKAQRVANFQQNTLKALKELIEAAGLNDPGELTPEHILRRTGVHQVAPLSEILPTVAPGQLLDIEPAYRDALPPHYRRYWWRCDADSFALHA